MMDLVVGCPVLRREWILEPWFEHVDRSAKLAGITPHFAFVGDLENDPSFGIIDRCTTRALLVHVQETRAVDRRDWATASRYHRMVELRNLLLFAVRAMAPLAFLSLDSDILIHRDLLGRLLEDVLSDSYDAVGGRCYMTPSGTSYPSWARLGRGDALQREDANGYFPVDVIMAIKMMSPAAYHIDYEHHLQGEDVGWSKAARRAGLRLGWDGSLVSKHVLAPELLHRVDPRVGF